MFHSHRHKSSQSSHIITIIANHHTSSQSSHIITIITHHYSRSELCHLRSQSQPSTGYRHSDSVSLSEKYGGRRSGYEEQSDRLESFSVESVHCSGAQQKRIVDGLKKLTRAYLHLFASNSRYETEDQSEYQTDEEEANGLPQTDLDERETEIGCKPN